MHIFLVIFILCGLQTPLCAALAINSPCDAVVLMDADTHHVIFAKNPHKKLFPASTTKIATAYFALSLCPDHLETMITAQHDAVCAISKNERIKSSYKHPSWWLEVGNTKHMGIKNGEELSFLSLLQGNLITSAGDASNVLAQYVGGTIGEFMNHLSRFLIEKGVNNTHFKNPHGVHDPEHVTTAYDMAKLFSYCIEDEVFKDILQQKYFIRPTTNKQQSITLAQTNKLIDPKKKHYYPYAIGGKTGYTEEAGYCLVAAAKKGDRTLVIALFNAKNKDERFEEAIRLFDEAFAQEKVEKLYLPKGAQQLAKKIPGADKVLTTFTREPLIYSYYPYEKKEVVCHLTWDALSLPIHAKEKVGAVILQSKEGKRIGEVSLFAQSTIKNSFFTNLKQKIYNYWLYLFLFFCFIFLYSRLYAQKKRR